MKAEDLESDLRQIAAYRMSLAVRLHHPDGALPWSSLIAVSAWAGLGQGAFLLPEWDAELSQLSRAAFAAAHLVKAQTKSERSMVAVAALLAFPPRGVGERLRREIAAPLWSEPSANRIVSLLVGRTSRVPPAVRLLVYVQDEWPLDTPQAQLRRRLAGRSAVAVYAAWASVLGRWPVDGPIAQPFASLRDRYWARAAAMLSEGARPRAAVVGE